MSYSVGVLPANMVDSGYVSMMSKSMEGSLKAESIPAKKKTPSATKNGIHFVNFLSLLKLYPCTHCHDVLDRPHQTPCGHRICKSCIAEIFSKSERIVPCPMHHEDMDDDEFEECQVSGLLKKNIIPDPAVARRLLREECLCKNHEYGCCERIQLKQLKDHEANCAFTPEPCPNNGCSEYFAPAHISEHLMRCEYSNVECSYCHQPFPRIGIEKHHLNCNLAGTQCVGCGKSFAKRSLLITHQRISADCLTKAGKCHYHDYCAFETHSVGELQQHLKEKRDQHLESLTLTVYNAIQSSTKSEEIYKEDVHNAVRKKIKPLERITAQISMEVKNVGQKLESSGTNGEALQNAMRVVDSTSHEVEGVKGRVTQIEKQIKDSGLDRVTVIESHSQSIRRNNELLSDSEKRVRNLEVTSYDGTLIWKIKDYKRRKSDAVRGRQMSIYSHPFYTSRTGYKLCLRAYINGDGLGRGKCLSLFFVVMRGEYDDLLEFPFKQRVTFSLLCPKNPELHKIETFLPDPDSSSFRRPQTDMNIASGCPQFAPHSLVESSNFLLNDCIYIRAVVEPGGDKIP